MEDSSDTETSHLTVMALYKMMFGMALFQVSQMSLENEVKFGQLISHNKMKLVNLCCYAEFVTMATIVISCDYVC